MNTLVTENYEAHAQNVIINEDSLTVDMVDGRTIIAPLSWYPRLWYGKPEERANFEIIGDGAIIHWPGLALMKTLAYQVFWLDVAQVKASSH